MKEITFVQALNEAVDEEMQRDSRVFILVVGLSPFFTTSIPDPRSPAESGRGAAGRRRGAARRVYAR